MEDNSKAFIKNASIFIGIILMVCGYTLTKVLGSMDEIWMYNFARCILEGMLPYRDFSIIVTPLLPMILSIFLKIFGQELIVVRILEILETSIILFLVYKILIKLKVNKYISLIATVIIFNINSYAFFFNYSWLVLLFALIILYYELDQKNEFFELYWKRDLILGIIAGFSILTKQTTGAVIAICFAGYKLLMIDNVNDLRKFAKILGIRIIGILIPVLLFLVYLLYNNIVWEFVDYAILGLKTFTNSVSYITVINDSRISVRILAYIVPVTLLAGIITYIIALIKDEIRKKEWFRNMYILLVYSVAVLVVIIPLADYAHFAVGSICTFILIIYLLYVIFKKVSKYIKFKDIINKIIGIVAIGVFLLSIFNSMKLVLLYKQCLASFRDLNHFHNIIISEDLYEIIADVDRYILEQEEKGKKVYILHYSSGCFNIPIDKYYKNYDMFNIGNFGSRGEDGIIEDLENDQNFEILITGAFGYNQHPNKVVEYVIEHYNKIGEVNCFGIYEK